jgi:hypothetical protein
MTDDAPDAGLIAEARRAAPWLLRQDLPRIAKLVKLVTRLADRLAAKGEEGWRPIETAPRDGTEVYLWSPDAGDGGEAFTGYWQDCEDYPGGGAWWSRPTDPFNIDSDPTRWRPLPPPPEPSKTGPTVTRAL